jgi:hypothetical protein
LTYLLSEMTTEDREQQIFWLEEAHHDIFAGS